MDAAAVTLGAKSDLCSVRREHRRAVVGLVARQAQRISTGHLLHPYVEVSFRGTVRGECHEPAVWRQGRLRAQAGVRRQTAQLVSDRLDDWLRPRRP
jgi:hypothetical protein